MKFIKKINRAGGDDTLLVQASSKYPEKYAGFDFYFTCFSIETEDGSHKTIVDAIVSPLYLEDSYLKGDKNRWLEDTISKWVGKGSSIFDKLYHPHVDVVERSEATTDKVNGFLRALRENDVTPFQRIFVEV